MIEIKVYSDNEDYSTILCTTRTFLDVEDAIIFLMGLEVAK